MNKRTKISLLGFALVFIPIMLMKVKPVPKRDDRVWKEYVKAEAPILVPGSGTEEAEKFAADLRAIDLSGAPSYVRRAMENYIAVVERNLAVRRAGGDVEASNEEVVRAKKVFSKAIGRWKARRFLGKRLWFVSAYRF